VRRDRHGSRTGRDLANADAPEDDHEQGAPGSRPCGEREGFNLHAGVRIEAGDDLGRESMARLGATISPPRYFALQSRSLLNRARF
jgi:hypothetical protein